MDVREHYIGDQILRALLSIDESSPEWELRGRHPSNVDFEVTYSGGNYIRVVVQDSDEGYE